MWLLNWMIREDNIAASRRELRAGLESNWLNYILKGLRYSLTGWWASLLRSITVIILIIVIMTFALSSWKKPDFSCNTRNLYDVSKKARWGLWRLEEKTSFTSLKGWESCQMKNHWYPVQCLFFKNHWPVKPHNIYSVGRRMESNQPGCANFLPVHQVIRYESGVSDQQGPPKRPWRKKNTSKGEGTYINDFREIIIIYMFILGKSIYVIQNRSFFCT